MAQALPFPSWPHLGDAWTHPIRSRAQNPLCLLGQGYCHDHLECPLCTEHRGLGREEAVSTAPQDAEQRAVHPGQEPLGRGRGTWRPSWKRRHASGYVRSERGGEVMGSIQWDGIFSPWLSGTGPQLIGAPLSCHCTPKAPEAWPTVVSFPAHSPKSGVPSRQAHPARAWSLEPGALR